jgi:hypothetical protein
MLAKDCLVPAGFERFFNYRKFNKDKRPQMGQDILQGVLQLLSELLLLPCLAWPRFAQFKADVEQFRRGVNRRLTLLKEASVRVAASSGRTTPAREFENAGFLQIVDAVSVTKLDARYVLLNNTMSTKAHYQIADISEYLPSSNTSGPGALAQSRHRWVSDLQLTVDVELFSWDTGNHGKLFFAWSVPHATEQRSHDRGTKNAFAIVKDLPMYVSRAVRSAASALFNSLPTKFGAGERDKLFTFLTGDSSAPDHAADKELRLRLDEFLAYGDPDLVLDYRVCNGNAANPKLSAFWDELDSWVVEVCGDTVHERRHGDPNVSFLPAAISIPDLVSTISDRLKAKHPGEDLPSKGIMIPSDRWVALQFLPRRPGSHSALFHTGRFKLQYKVQTRQLHHAHEDAHYQSAQIKLQRSFALKYRNYVLYVCLDDKHKIDVGEPGTPVETGARQHHAAIAGSKQELTASDHSFHTASLTPSGVLVTEIPEQLSDSWYHGKLYISLKDAALEPSSPLRHMAELVAICRARGVPVPPILLALTDGGPDHNTSFYSVIVGWMLVFFELDLDLLWATRPAPGQSWQDPVERCFSLLNLALQHVALARTMAEEKFEQIFKTCGSLSDVRAHSAADPDVHAAWLQTLSDVKGLLMARFQRLTWTGERVAGFPPASDADMNLLWDLALKLDADLDKSKLQKVSALASVGLQSFLKYHAYLDKYNVQFKKIGDPTCPCAACKAGLIKPPRLPPGEFAALHFGPTPVPRPAVEGKVKYGDFDTVYGAADPTTVHCPSTKASGAKRDGGGTAAAGLLKPQFVRGRIECVECLRPRLVFSLKAVSKIDADEGAAHKSTFKSELERRVTDATFVCGAPLFEPGHPFAKLCVVNPTLRCGDEMEVQSYSTAKKFPSLGCGNCGQTQALDFDPYDANLSENATFKELASVYQSVAPQCALCKEKKLPRRIGKKRSAQVEAAQKKGKRRRLAQAAKPAAKGATSQRLVATPGLPNARKETAQEAAAPARDEIIDGPGHVVLEAAPGPPDTQMLHDDSKVLALRDHLAPETAPPDLGHVAHGPAPAPPDAEMLDEPEAAHPARDKEMFNGPDYAAPKGDAVPTRDEPSAGGARGKQHMEPLTSVTTVVGEQGKRTRRVVSYLSQ